MSDAVPTRLGFPNPEALNRLAGAVLVEAHDERQLTAECRYLSFQPKGCGTKPRALQNTRRDQLMRPEVSAPVIERLPH